VLANPLEGPAVTAMQSAVDQALLPPSRPAPTG